MGKRDKRFLSSRDVGVDGKFLLCAKILTGYEKSGTGSQVQGSGFRVRRFRVQGFLMKSGFRVAFLTPH